MPAGRILLNYGPHPEHLARLHRAAPGWEITPAENEDEARHLATEAVAILGNRFFLQSLPAARRLRWFQSNSVGVDLVLSDPAVAARGIVVTNARGVYDGELADHAVSLLLALVRGVGRWAREMAGGGWERRPLARLEEVPTLLLGFGGVGRAVARRLAAFGTPLSAVRRRHREDGAARAARELGVELLEGGDLGRALGRCRAVVVALPLTGATRGILDRDRLALLPEGAFLVNVARGALLDEAALRERLPRLGGVALDVFAQEPLPPGHWLRRDPRVVLTPHVGRSPETGRPRWEGLFEENLRRFAAGEELLNVVDPEAGY